MSLRVRESTQPNVRVGYLLRVPDLYLLHRWHTDSGQQLTEIAEPLSAGTRIPPCHETYPFVQSILGHTDCIATRSSRLPRKVSEGVSVRLTERA
jgi:hypothetical protein